MIIMNKRCIFVIILLFIISALVLGINLFVGSAEISPNEILEGIFGGRGDFFYDILWKIRIPRVLAAMILGGALALSGYLLQTFFHNPIAGPFVLGVSSGAKLVVAIVMIAAANKLAPLGSASLITAAFIGSLLSLGFILVISRRTNHISVLVICGVMIGYICSAATEFIITFADDSDIINLHSWSMGSFSGMDMDSVKTAFVVTAVCFVCTMALSKPIGAYRLGEQYAASLGVPTGLLRGALILLSGLLSACVTAFAGPVSFVGIAVPHISGAMLKSSKPVYLIPASFLGGGIACMLCDMIARTVFSPVELSISTVTAIFGAPVVIMIMLKRKRGSL